MEDDIDEFALKITEVWGHGTEYIEPSSYIYLERNKVESEFLFEQLESFIFNGVRSLYFLVQIENVFVLTALVKKARV